MSCLAENTIVAFAEGRLSPEAVVHAEDHLGTCAACREHLLAALGTSSDERDAAETTSVPRGTVIGRYTILGLTGRGGIGEVYAAYDAELDRKVALKLLRASGGSAADEKAQARLLREAKAMARLSDPNVVAVHDVGTFADRVFVAMEFVDGVTLKEWLAEAPRSRREILRMFELAGRGLAAAHGAGLVHRDFKPHNVMVARDGTVRVTDFGLVRTLGDVAERLNDHDDAIQPPPPDLHATRTGELVGTPLYMAPEQFRGEAIDARADQFSFCVALYEALYGAPPFDGSTLPALMAEVLAGRVRPPPARSTVPAWLRRVLVRGLSVDRETRWPSMEDLLTALARDPATVRRRRSGVLAAALLVALAGGALWRETNRPSTLCRGGPARIAGAWNPAGAPGPRRAVVERAFLASGAPAAGDVWERVAAVLDRYAKSWLAAYEDACQATHLRRQQTTAILDLRMSCLDARRSSLLALTDVLASADHGVVSSAVEAANALPALDACADLEALQADIAPPRDAQTRTKVEAVRKRIAVAKALTDTGRTTESFTLAQGLLVEARALGYQPLVAEALLRFTWARSSDHFSRELQPFAEETVWTALAAGRDDVAAEAAVGLVFGTGRFLGDFEASERWSRMATALLDRLGARQDRLRSWLLTNESAVRFEQGRFEEALDLARSARALKEKILPADSVDIALSMTNEGEALHKLGRDEEALAINAQIYPIFVRSHGPASIQAAYTLGNRGDYLVQLGRFAEAEPPLRLAAKQWEAQVGANSDVGYPLTTLGRALLGLGRPRDALPPLERANRFREAGNGDPLIIAETRFVLARALWEAGVDRRRARDLARRAREAYAKETARAKEQSEVDAWLKSHDAE